MNRFVFLIEAEARDFGLFVTRCAILAKFARQVVGDEHGHVGHAIAEDFFEIPLKYTYQYSAVKVTAREAADEADIPCSSADKAADVEEN